MFEVDLNIIKEVWTLRKLHSSSVYPAVYHCVWRTGISQMCWRERNNNRQKLWLMIILQHYEAQNCAGSRW